MKLYHGSYIAVSQPLLKYSRINIDFGVGFYTTPMREHAQKWATRFKKEGKKAYLSIYDFNESILSKLKVLQFEKYDEVWLDQVISCRMGNDVPGYDLIIGGIANDKVFNTIELFMDNLIEKKEALRRLQFEQPNIQYCFKNQEVIDKYLKFEQGIEL